MENFRAPVFQHAHTIVARLGSEHVEEWTCWWAWEQAWIFAQLIALAGGRLAGFFYLKFFPSKAGQPAPAWARTVRSWSLNKFYIDELYDLVIIRPLRF